MSNNAFSGFTPIWEGKITDGSFQPKELLKQANKDMDTKWKATKPRPKYICKLKPINGTVALQFTDPTGERSRSPKGIGCRLTNNGVLEAVEKANLVTQAIQTGTFNWEWFESTIQKKKLTTNEKKKLKEEKEKEEENKPVGELFAAYKKHWFDENNRSNNPKKNIEGSWYQANRHPENTFLDKNNQNKSLNATLIVQCIACSKKDSYSRKYLLNGLQKFLEYVDKWDEHEKLIEKYKKDNNPKPKEKYIPSEEEVEYVFENAFTVEPKYQKRWGELRSKYRFLYALIAVYGIRIHEAWNIKNWDKPVTMGKEDWVEIEEFTDNYEDIEKDNIKSQQFQLREKKVYPAIQDENNRDKILAIGHETKTGYRLAMPISPIGKDWFKQFELNQPLNLPDIKNPLEYNSSKSTARNCSKVTASWWGRRKCNFTLHALRHVCNHHGYMQGHSTSTLSQSLGHSIEMNTTTYHHTMSIENTYNSMVGEKQQIKNKQSESEKLKEQAKELEKKVVQLETTIQFKDEEIERLRTELQMMKAVQS